MSVKHLLLSATSYLAALRGQRLEACTAEKLLCATLLFQPVYAPHSTKPVIFVFNSALKSLVIVFIFVGTQIPLWRGMMLLNNAWFSLSLSPFLYVLGKNRSKKCILLRRHKNSWLSWSFSGRLRGRLIHWPTIDYLFPKCYAEKPPRLSVENLTFSKRLIMP